MSNNPNTVKSFDDINEGGRKSDVVLSAVEKCERLQKQLDIAKGWLKEIADSVDVYFEKDRSMSFTQDVLMGCGLSANQGLHDIEELNEVHKQE